MPTAKKSKTRRNVAKKTRAKKTAAKKKTTKKGNRGIAVKSKSATSSLESRILEPLAEIEKLLSQLRPLDWLRPSTWEWPELPSLDVRAPSIDIIDRAKEIVVKAEVPGIDLADLDISVSDRTLTIKGATRHEEETQEGDMHRREIRSGSIYRTLTLPAEVIGSKAKATCKDGVLKLRLPKARTAKKHSIKVS
jgi:HSP20 family protein